MESHEAHVGVRVSQDCGCVPYHPGCRDLGLSGSIWLGRACPPFRPSFEWFWVVFDYISVHKV